jgi:hypothetical protein
MRNARWSPNGRLIAASSEDAKGWPFFDNGSKRWTKVDSMVLLKDGSLNRMAASPTSLLNQLSCSIFRKLFGC